MFKRTGYELYCEELFVVKCKSKFCCESAIYFNLGANIIKENCHFKFYFNKTDSKPSILDGSHENVIANWLNCKHMVCLVNNNVPVKIPSYPYVLLNRSIQCNYDTEAEKNFLLESHAACHKFFIKFGNVLYCKYGFYYLF